MANESLDVLLGLKKKREAEGIGVPAPDYFTGNRNQAKTDALRKALGLEGPAAGDISQMDYENAYNDLVIPQQERAFREKIAPAQIQAQGAVEAAKARANATAEQAASTQTRQQAFQAEQNRLSREAAAARQKTAVDAIMVPTMDPETGITTWVPRSGAAGMRTGGSATERKEIQEGQNTIDNINSLIQMGDELGWKGIGPAGGVKNQMYKFLGIGDPREDDFRSALQKTRADIMFGAGGKQLTTAEQKVAAGYLTDIYTNPTAARSRLAEVQKLLQRAQARRTGGEVPNINQSVGDESDWEDVQ